ncbi:carbon-nitrogen hydrolase family protein [Poseidonocella sp. HB161398]|uniref:carbon-nitrogen hydrolase family protein n=1 Tax=Poseidonocella sp. HB161398 TaxID=2320855 RepID=UPI001981A177|nr:carbon-nitrogen hydrolase family protein [Poseidonocella sp. HB161398]
MSMSRPVRVAAIHAAPVFHDRIATTRKAVSLIAEAAERGASLAAFPESFIPGFPVWAALWAPIYNHDLYAEFVEASIYADGPEIAEIRAAAARHRIAVWIGFSERNPASCGGIWNSALLIDETGRVAVHHRKLVPTFFEKMVWAPGDGAGLQVADLGRTGRVGGLICGENTNPLARFALMAQAEELHISCWPPIWPTRPPSDARNFDNLAANRIRAAAHCFEAKAFGIVCAALLGDDCKEMLVRRDPGVAAILEGADQAESFFLDPTGKAVGESARDREAVIVADLDLADCIEPKQFHDLTGYYNRFDIFGLEIDRRRLVPATFSDLPRPAPAERERREEEEAALSG